MEWPIISFSVCNAFPTMAVYFNLIFKNNFEWKCAISHNEIGNVICVNIYTIPHHPYVMQMIMFLFIFRFFCFSFFLTWAHKIYISVQCYNQIWLTECAENVYNVYIWDLPVWCSKQKKILSFWYICTVNHSLESSNRILSFKR